MTKAKSTCSICEMQVANLSRHTKTHLKKDINKCDFCDYQSNSSYNLSSHIRGVHLHLLTKNKACGLCPTKFLTKALLGIHMQSKHKIDAGCKTFNCTFCSYSTPRKGDFNRHLNTHDEKRMSFLCDICHGSYKSARLLQTHVSRIHNRRIHNTIEENKCELCKKSFSRPSRLKNHVFVVHMGNLHKCDICHQEFTDKVNLKKHKENTHSSDTSLLSNFAR